MIDNKKVFKNLSKRNKKEEINKTNLTEEKKINKEKRLLEEAFKLFTSKGIISTSVQDIVDKANVAKGTFYLYFKDKYELRDILIMRKSQKLFSDALKKMKQENIKKFTDQIIFVIDYVIDELIKNPLLVQFIAKDLGWGVFNKTIIRLSSTYEDDNNDLYELFLRGVEENNIKLKNPEATLFMIIELVSSTCFTCIMYNEPLPINEYKPILYDEIRKMINE